MVNGTETPPTDILESGLPQGSTLAPILYIFFNAALMEEKANGRRGNMGFVDDYTRWAISDSIDRNMSVLNDKVVPRALQWAKDSGATFEGDKTILMHFTRNRRKSSQPSQPLKVGPHEVTATKQERILGVIFDAELRFKNHMTKVKDRGWKNAGQLHRLHHIGPKAARQLFHATIASRTDYAAPVWYSQHLGSKHTNIVGNVLLLIQKLGAQAIVKCFKTASMEAASAEAALQAPHVRLQLKIARFWVKVHTLPDDNPIKVHLRKLRTEGQGPKGSFRSPLQHMFTHLLGPEMNMEIIPAWTNPPWECRPTGGAQAAMETEAAVAAHNADVGKHVQIYADGSVKNGVAGIGITATLRRVHIKSHCQRIGEDDRVNINTTELGAILEAAKWAKKMTETIAATIAGDMEIVIYSDSQIAVYAIGSQVAAEGASMVTEICNLTRRRVPSQRRISIKWIPKAAKIPGHVEADRLAKIATASSNAVTQPTEWSVRGSRKQHWDVLAKRILSEGRSAPWTTGRALQITDGAMPGNHVTTLYDTLNKKEASILSQLRLGHARMNGFLFKIGIADSAKCDCGHGTESVRHFLQYCSRYTAQRQILADKLGPRFGNTSHMLGGRNSHAKTGHVNPDGPAESWKPDMEMVRAVIRYAADTGRLSYRALEEDGVPPPEVVEAGGRARAEIEPGVAVAVEEEEAERGRGGQDAGGGEQAG